MEHIVRSYGLDLFIFVELGDIPRPTLLLILNLHLHHLNFLHLRRPMMVVPCSPHHPRLLVRQQIPLNLQRHATPPILPFLPLRRDPPPDQHHPLPLSFTRHCFSRDVGGEVVAAVEDLSVLEVAGDGGLGMFDPVGVEGVGGGGADLLDVAQFELLEAVAGPEGGLGPQGLLLLLHEVLQLRHLFLEYG